MCTLLIVLHGFGKNGLPDAVCFLLARDQVVDQHSDPPAVEPELDGVHAALLDVLIFDAKIPDEEILLAFAARLDRSQEVAVAQLALMQTGPLLIWITT
eukprot:2572467-Rhodomonas_salina.2